MFEWWSQKIGVLGSRLGIPHQTADGAVDVVVRGFLDPPLQAPEAFAGFGFVPSEFRVADVGGPGQRQGLVDDSFRKRIPVVVRLDSIRHVQRVGRGVVGIAEGIRDFRALAARAVVPVRQRPVGGPTGGFDRFSDDPLEVVQVHPVPGQEVPAQVFALVPEFARGLGGAVDAGLVEPAIGLVHRPRFHHRHGGGVVPQGFFARAAADLMTDEHLISIGHESNLPHRTRVKVRLTGAPK